MPEPFDVHKGPQKIFADTVHARIINGLHHITFQSGKELFTFVIPAGLSKVIARGLMKQVEEIEQKSGIKFDDRLPGEPMPSPWQPPPQDENK